ncbi:hypothetical protein ALI22I_19165 [Saccharothrix sp. ALI-22-I]|nr:hypothetical protein ALI22I_19165 [Saccharothrix sp. ALI-22-I]
MKQVREAARQQAHDEWVRNQPRPTSPRLVPDRVLEWGGGRLRRRTKQHRWDEGLLESCRQAAEKAVREYREQFRLTHGVDPEDLVKDARRKLHLLWDEENEFKHAADMVMREVSRRLHWEWKWDVDQIAERLHRTYDEVRRDVEIPDPHRRSRAHGSRGGSDDGSRYYGFGDETGPRFSEGGGGGGSGE